MTPIGDAHWRDSAREIRFFFFDGKAVFPFVLFLLHIEWWTFFVATGVASFLTVLNYFGFSIVVFFRLLRASIAGKRKLAIPWWLD